MKKLLILIFLFLVLFPAQGFGQQLQKTFDMAFPVFDAAGVEVKNTIDTSKAQNADLLTVDFEPDTWDAANGLNPKMMIMLIPATAAAVVYVQCDFWNGTTNVTETIDLNGGTALPAGAGYDFDIILDSRDQNCNLQSSTGGVQNWTVLIKKTYNSNR